MAQRKKPQIASGQPKTLRLEHVRSPDYREYRADAMLHRTEGDVVVITFTADDRVLLGENMTLVTADGEVATYKIESVEEKRQRLDLFAVRVPLSELLSTAAQVQAKRAQQAENE